MCLLLLSVMLFIYVTGININININNNNTGVTSALGRCGVTGQTASAALTPTQVSPTGSQTNRYSPYPQQMQSQIGLYYL